MIEELKIPTIITATDVDHGRIVSFKKGKRAEMCIRDRAWGGACFRRVRSVTGYLDRQEPLVPGFLQPDR